MILFKEKEFIPLPQLKTEICPRISTQDLLHVCELTNGNAGPKGQKKTKPRGLVMDVRLSDEYPFIRLPFTILCNIMQNWLRISVSFQFPLLELSVAILNKGLAFTEHFSLAL